MVERGSDADQAITMLLDLLRDPNEEIRVRSLIALSELGDKDVIKSIIARFSDDSENVRMWASSALLNKHKAVSLPFLIDLSLNPDENVRVRTTAIWTLHEFSENSDAEAALIYLANDPNPQIQISAIESLGRAFRVSAYRILLLMLKSQSSNKAIQEAVKNALERIQSVIAV